MQSYSPRITLNPYLCVYGAAVTLNPLDMVAAKRSRISPLDFNLTFGCFIIIEKGKEMKVKCKPYKETHFRQCKKCKKTFKTSKYGSICSYCTSKKIWNRLNGVK